MMTPKHNPNSNVIKLLEEIIYRQPWQIKESATAVWLPQKYPIEKAYVDIKSDEAGTYPVVYKQAE